MTQLWSYRGKAQQGIPAIDCRFHYLNHFDTYADLVALYNSRVQLRPRKQRYYRKHSGNMERSLHLR